MDGYIGCASEARLRTLRRIGAVLVVLLALVWLPAHAAADPGDPGATATDRGRSPVAPAVPAAVVPADTRPAGAATTLAAGPSEPAASAGPIGTSSSRVLHAVMVAALDPFVRALAPALTPTADGLVPVL